jgi:putative acetyltransferase
VTLVRSATAADVEQIDAVLDAAFGGDQVPRLVHALRADTADADRVELVAEDAGQVVGHVLVTPIPLETAPGATTTLACLSPLGVRPDVSGRGIGTALVHAALAEAERRGEAAVVIEGDPAYYRRFGFVPASGQGLRRPSERTPEPAFQVRVLHGSAPRGRALYPRAFWDADAVGLPFDGVPWLDELERACRFVERAVTGDVLAAPVPSCPGWDVAELLRHVGVVQRTVTEWIGAGRHPRSTPSAPADGDVRAWFADGWRRLQEVLDSGPPGTPAPTWCPWTRPSASGDAGRRTSTWSTRSTSPRRSAARSPTCRVPWRSTASTRCCGSGSGRSWGRRWAVAAT